MSLFRLLAAALVCASIVACAPMVTSAPSQLTAVPVAQQTTLTVSHEIEVALVWQYKSVIRAGTRWRLIGRVREGDVFRPIDTVFAVEGRNVHEAYLVLHDGKLVGFYLVGEARFAPMDTPIPFD
jgi:hypothetical protein